MPEPARFPQAATGGHCSSFEEHMIQTPQRQSPAAPSGLSCSLHRYRYLADPAGGRIRLLPAARPVAALPAVMLALVLGREGFNKNLETFFKGSARATSWPCASSICWRGLRHRGQGHRRGGCHSRARPPHPGWCLLPGLFLISPPRGHRHGHSISTIGAVAPVARWRRSRRPASARC